MKIKKKINEFKAEHPTVVKVVNGLVITAGVTALSYAGYTCYEHAKEIGLRVEITTYESREATKELLGDARELLNAALGIEAKGLDAGQTMERYQAIADTYVGKVS